MTHVTETKLSSGVGIWDFLNKIPAGTMFVPLVISSIIVTATIHSDLKGGLIDVRLAAKTSSAERQTQ